jgi:hypothetical protein
MRLYRGNAHWLYQQLKRNYIEVYKNEKGMLPYSDFKTKIENGSEFWFAGSSYKLAENLTSTGIPNFKNDTFSI